MVTAATPNSYAERPWLKRYDAHVPPSLTYPDVPLHQFLIDTAHKHPNNVALVTSARIPVLGRVSKTISYKELNDQSDAFAVALIDLGLKKGDRVALVMPNIAAFVIGYYGVLKAGGVVAATNPTYPAEKMQQQINDCDAEIVVVMSMFYKTVKQIQPQTKLKKVIVTNVKDWLPTPARILFQIAKEKKEGHFVESLGTNDYSFTELLAKYAGQKPSIKVTSEDLAIFQYTGGTTGVPKAAMSQHKALVANMLQCKSFLMGTENDNAQNEVFLGAIPMFHAYGLITVVGFAIVLGARIVFVPNARAIDDLLDVINTFQPTVFMGVPALYNALNNHAKVRSGEMSLKSIRICMSGSAPLSPSVKAEFERLSGGTLLEGYGMSEAPTASHANPLRGENRTGSIGLPFPDMDMRIVSLDDGETDLPVGEIGELLMSGPQLMVGYHGMPTETANTLRSKDGKTWLYTGDIARMDEDGYFYIVDRKKDMAIIGGYNVYPNAVEKALAAHPAIREVGVAAIPHPDKPGQEALKAWVVLKDDAQVTEKDLIEFATQHLARYEVPTRLSFVPELPKTTVGKTLRRELVQMEMEERERTQQ